MEKTLNDILEDARNCPIKGRLYIYEQYKQEIEKLELSSYDYTDACRTLANILEV